MVIISTDAIAADSVGRQKVTELEHAISARDTNALSALIKQDANLCNVTIFFTRRPIIIAASRGWLSVVNLLLEKGADVNVQGDTWETSNHQMTALQAAIQYNQPEIVKRLLAAGANPNLMNHTEGSALHYALRYQHEDMATWLLEAGADAFLEDGNPYVKSVPFELAITRGSGRLIPQMLTLARVRTAAPKTGAKLLQQDLLPPLSKRAAVFLEKRGVDLLAIAAQRGELEAVTALLQAGVAVQTKTTDGYSVLQVASRSIPGIPKENAKERRRAIRQLLEKNGAKMDAFAATGFGDRSAARQLMEQNREIVFARDPDGNTPLHWAIRENQIDLAEFWIKSGANLSATNLAGQTPLHLAAVGGLAELTQHLLDAGAPTGVRDTNGWTPFKAATEAKQSATIRLLLPKAAGANASKRGPTLMIHKAAAAGNLAVLSAETTPENVNARNELGLTPLHVAIQNGRFAAAAFLIDHAADVDARDPDGNTAIQLAIRKAPYSVDSPPATWLSRIGNTSEKQNWLRFFNPKIDEDIADRGLLQAVGFLLACGVDAAATNHAGQTALQLALDESTFLFPEDRPKLAQMLSSAGANVDRADADGNSALHLAGIDTDGDRVSALLEAGASINATNHQGRTPLHVFAQKIYTWDLDDGMDAPFQRLLKAHPNVNAQDHEGFTPLHVLAQADTSFKVEATKALLEAGANPNLRDHHGRTPVHLFLTGKWPWSEASECLQLLLEAGADFSARDDQQRTPLHYLAALGERDEKPLFFLKNMDKVFIAAKVDFEARDVNGDTPLHLAAKSGVMEVYEWLVKQGANVDVTNAAGETPRLLALHSDARSLRFRTDPETDIFVAARAGKLDAVASLLKAEPRLLNETNFSGQTALALAALAHRTNVLKFLDGKGAQWDPASAVLAGRVETLRTLISKQSPNETQLNNWLHLAAAQGSVESARLLLDRGADVNAPDARGMSPLGWARRCRNVAMEKFLSGHNAKENIFDAAYGNDSEIAKALLKSDKNLAFATNSFGISATQVAAFAGADDILSSFLRQKVPVNLADPHYRQTLLHLATMNDHSSTVELLIRRGAEINAYDRFGFTPLHLAAYLGSTESMKVLLRHHADPELSINIPKDGLRGMSRVPYAGATGDTALHLAAQTGATNAILLLTQSGVSINSTNRFGGTPLDAASAFPHMGGMFEPRILERILTPLNAAAIATNKNISYPPRGQSTISFIEQLGGKHGKPRSVPTGIMPFSAGSFH